MIVLSNTNAQTLQPGQAILFDDVVVSSCNGCTCHRRNTGSVKLRDRGTYLVSFGANVDGATAEAGVQLSVQLSGVTLPETTAISSSTGINNISRQTLVRNCCDDYDRVSIVNTGTVPVVISPNAVLTVTKLNTNRGDNCTWRR